MPTLIPLFDKIDTILERYGSFNSVQKFRLRVAGYYADRDCQLDGFPTDQTLIQIIKFDKALREIVQREHCLTERVRAGTDDKKRLQEWEEELEALPHTYWFLERELYKWECLLPITPFRKAYDTWKAKPKWYLHRDLTNDCAGRGGCCGRECGCCARREPTSNRRKGVGHCTLECGCCAKARGFELTADDKKKAQKEVDFAITHKTNITYYCRMLQAFFIGIESKQFWAPKWKSF